VGPRTNRIAREDFLIPPEFRDIAAKGHPASRVGGICLELTEDTLGTRLGHCFDQIPLRVMPAFHIGGEKASLLYLINLTAGLMDGDAHLVAVNARAGTHCVVTGQSATRVHPALASYATQQWDVSVDRDATLVVLPGPLIPYAGCRYYQRGRVELAPSAKLLWGEIWYPGRYSRGADSERFLFERIVQDFQASRDGEPFYRDRFCWDGPWTKEQSDWHFGGELASGSLLVAGPMPELNPVSIPSLRRSVFRLESGDTCLRWCGSPAMVTKDLVETTMRIAGQWTSGPEAPPWLLDSTGLTSNHWFSSVIGSD
jgi:urease accessory protein